MAPKRLLGRGVWRSQQNTKQKNNRRLLKRIWNIFPLHPHFYILIIFLCVKTKSSTAASHLESVWSPSTKRFAPIRSPYRGGRLMREINCYSSWLQGAQHGENPPWSARAGCHIEHNLFSLVCPLWFQWPHWCVLSCIGETRTSVFTPQQVNDHGRGRQTHVWTIHTWK